jgi:uncharacterized protein (DUF983 family)
MRVMLWRGLRRRCPRCGGKNLFASRFTMRERCPTCDLLFAREEGFWLGAYVINFGIGEGLVAVLLLVFLFVAINHPGMALAPWLVGGVALAIIVPIAFFRSSRTLWTAIDLAMRSEDDLT